MHRAFVDILQAFCVLYEGRHEVCVIKIETGICKGLKLQVAPEETRPTLARVRGAILNSLQIKLSQGASVLDLFAGTGVMGIEAVSRGAGNAVFVENSRSVAALLKSNVEQCRKRCEIQGVASSLQVVIGDVAHLPTVLPATCFDVILSDPPYADTAKFVEGMAKDLKPFCAPGALWVLEHERRGLKEEQIASVLAHGWTLMKSKTFGDVVIQFLQNQSS